MEFNKRLRLTYWEINAIKEVAKKVFGKDVKLWIFGSRTNPYAKGGDIDIYIETEIKNPSDLIDKQIKYLTKLKLQIGEQKIDLVIKPVNCEEEICKEAKSNGVRLI